MNCLKLVLLVAALALPVSSTQAAEWVDFDGTIPDNAVIFTTENSLDIGDSVICRMNNFRIDENTGKVSIYPRIGFWRDDKHGGRCYGKSKMSKRGSKYLRTALMQAAEVAVYRKKDPMLAALYQRQVDRGKHHTVALSHVANEMLHVIFSVLKNNRLYRPVMT